MRNINKLREERNNKVFNLEEKKRSIQEDRTRSAEYKSNQVSNIDKEILAIREELEPKIHNGIQEYKEKKLQEVHSAEFDITPEEASIELLKEIRVQAKTNELIGKYRGQDKAKIRNRLSDETRELIQAKSPYAKSYIAAMEELGIVGINIVSEQVELNSLNAKQVKSMEELEEIKQIERDFNRETNNRAITEVYSDAFKDVMSKYQ